MRPSLRGSCGPCRPRAGCGKAGLGPCWGAAPRQCVGGEKVQLCRGWEPGDSCRDSRQSAGLPSPSLAAGPLGRAAQALLLLRGLRPRASARSRLRGRRGMGEARARGAVPLSPRRRLCFSPRRRWPRGPRSRVGGQTPDAGMELGRGPARRGAGVKEIDSFYPDQDGTWGLEAEDCQELKPRLDYRE